MHEQQYNPLAAAEAETIAPASEPKRTAASVIANTTKESTEAWTKRARTSTPSDKDEDVPPIAGSAEQGPSDSSEVKVEAKIEPQVAAVVAQAREEGIIEPQEEAIEDSNMNGNLLHSDDEDLEEVQPAARMQDQPAPVTEDPPKRTIRITLKPNGNTNARRTPARSSKRKARSPVEEDEEDEEEQSEQDKRPGPRSTRGQALDREAKSARELPGRGKTKVARKAASTTTPVATRSLRSRQPKTEEKQKEERERQARLKAALASDAEESDEEE